MAAGWADAGPPLQSSNWLGTDRGTPLNVGDVQVATQPTCATRSTPTITPLSFCHHRKHPEIRSQNGVFQQPASGEFWPSRRTARASDLQNVELKKA
jgi:hypothetical protein